jgi:hypothetical protein
MQSMAALVSTIVPTAIHKAPAMPTACASGPTIAAPTGFRTNDPKASYDATRD